jgi:hypothetical protein
MGWDRVDSQVDPEDSDVWIATDLMEVPGGALYRVTRYERNRAKMQSVVFTPDVPDATNQEEES